MLPLLLVPQLKTIWLLETGAYQEYFNVRLESSTNVSYVAL